MIRVAQPSDVPQIAALHVRSWQVGYRGQMPDSFLDALNPGQRAAAWTRAVGDSEVTVLVGLRAETIVGFCSFLACRDDDASSDTCEIATLYVEPAHFRSGCGRALMEAVVEMARARSFRRVSLWVLATNSVARAFYESVGLLPDGRSKTDARLGIPLHEVRYIRELPTGT